ncbi:hypothetical protein CBR_g21032 [Chara braunii]|uniref:von Hippel-Lindau disease tumour suppressor beta domain-containing protein n=1 Tax=Chara braunii TaxID=69332 RepID=A0A388L0F3_CHABU|nr:hypothetical protein CBR_g21032 [Chara braunii]|eukprot:GBG75787.1 hypothetical protein CBR_g21032 [Chara braunii]
MRVVRWLRGWCTAVAGCLGRNLTGNSAEVSGVGQESSPMSGTGVDSSETPRFRSGPSHTSTVVVVVNSTDNVIVTLWIDYDGKEVPYDKLAPGAQVRQQTYVSHPWVFRDAATAEQLVVDRRLVLFPEEEEKVVHVRRPEVLEWNLDTHRRFPQDFREQVKEILRCHRRVYCGGHKSKCSTGDALPLADGPPAQRSRGSSPSMDAEMPIDMLGCRLGQLPPDLLLLIVKYFSPTIQDILPYEETTVVT